MQIRYATPDDIAAWRALSAEYDCYVKESVPDLTTWYGGDGQYLAFDAYMRSKIDAKEATIAVDSAGACLGIVSISKRKNRITFFGVIHGTDFFAVAEGLFRHALEQLDCKQDIYINEIISASERMLLHKKLYEDFGFVFSHHDTESGVPVHAFVKSPAVPLER